MDKFCLSCNRKSSSHWYHVESGIRSSAWLCNTCYHKLYRPNHKYSTSINRRKYYESNMDRILEINKTYREKNREIILQKKKEWSHSVGGRFSFLKKEVKKKRRELSISFDQFSELLSKPCYYCGVSLKDEAGYSLDRIDNSKGYSIENVLPCCGFCNRLRGNALTVEETKVVIEALKCFREAQLCVLV